jgi:hypothetical protein
MKKITDKTILQQGDKTFQPVKILGTIFWKSDCEISAGDYITDGYRVWKWKDNSSLLGRYKVVAQSERMFESLHLIDLQANNRRLILDDDYPIDLTAYRISDLKKVHELSKPQGVKGMEHMISFDEILESVNSIDIIEVDENFTIIDIYNLKNQ